MENVPYRELASEVTLRGGGNLGSTQTLTTANLKGGFEIKSIVVSVLASGETLPTSVRAVLSVGGVPMFNRIMQRSENFPQVFSFARSFRLPIFVNGLLLTPGGVEITVGLGTDTGTYFAQVAGSYVPANSIVTVPQSELG